MLENKRLTFAEENAVKHIEIKDKEVEGSKKQIEVIEDLTTAEIDFWSVIRDEIGETEQLIEAFYNKQLNLLDAKIEKEKQAYDDSKERENELRRIAEERGLDASESIKAEQEEQKRAAKAQVDLERKKQQIEIFLSSLRILAAKIEQGQGNPISNIKQDIANLKTFSEGNFYEGTPYTIGDALGYNGVRDGHVVNIDDRESILTGEHTKKLGIGKGKLSTNDIVNELDAYRNGILSKNMMPIFESNQPEVAAKVALNKLESMFNKTFNSKEPKENINFDRTIGVLEYFYKSDTKRTHRTYKIRK
jgi:hypothetical protein